ncbi:MAG TPA: DNA alkylation repair protein [Candidatus Thermoplasmatota archaeon]|nr:DNA alkylation repair protein [Candidatus Thermoplasmatota archaeon]
MPLLAAQRELRALASPARARVNAGYFKTGKGAYAEGQKFLGVRNPQMRALAREHRDLPLGEVGRMLASEWYEDRALALLVLGEQVRRADETGRRRIAAFYLRNLDRVDNWALVDLSAPYVLGPYLERRSRAILDRLAGSRNLWRRRVAMVTTQHFIRRGETGDALRIARLLLDDEHDLIHKAVGWMLREVGERTPGDLGAFLDRHAASMPRTMLRYAIEKLPAATRRRYLDARAKRRVASARPKR